MCDTTTSGPSRSLALPKTPIRPLLTATLCALLVGACDHDSPSEPREPRPEALTRAAAPAWAAKVIASLPSSARPVWDACRTAGTLHPAGTPFDVGINCRIVTVDGVDRRYVVHVPNHPLVTSGADVPPVPAQTAQCPSGLEPELRAAPVWRGRLLRAPNFCAPFTAV